MAHNKGYQKNRRNENRDRTKSKTRSFQVSLVDEPTALPQDDPNSTDTQILWSDRKLKPTKLYPCPTGVSTTRKPTPDEIKAAQEIAREFHYYTEKKVVVMDRSKGFQVIALIKFTPLDQLSESKKLELNIIAKFLHWVRRYVDTVGTTITESPEDYDTLMRNLALRASDILGAMFKNHANVAFEDNREKIKDANIPAMAALEFDAPLSPNDSAPNLSFTRDGFFNKQSIKISLLESEAADVAKEVKETDIVMQEVNQVTAQYIPFTQASSSIFFILQQLNVLNHFYQFSLQEWETFLNSTNHENVVSTVWPDASSALDSICQLLLLKCLRPNRMLSGIAIYVSKVFNAKFLVESSYNFHSVVTNKINSLIPEGYRLANQAIAAAIQTGSWVLLKNVHLASSWLSQLEKSLQSLNPPKSFRLFLTMETNSSIPVNILCQSVLIMNEPPPGICAHLVDCPQSISPSRLATGPKEKVRLYLLLAWLHTVVQKRLRYCPLGWSKIYEFNDSDLKAAMSMIDLWMIDPAHLPWAALWVLLRQAVYGGGVNSNWYQKLLDSFVDSLFNPGAFEVGYHLVNPISDKEGLIIAEGSQLEHFVTWAQALSKREPPHWLSLPPNTEALISTTHTTRKLKATGLSRHGAPTQAQANLCWVLGSSSKHSVPQAMACQLGPVAPKFLVVSGFQNLVTFIEDELVGEAPNQAKTSSDNTSSQPGRMRQMERTSKEFLKSLNPNLPDLNLESNNLNDPLFRFFEREIALGQKVLAVIRKDSIELIAVCNGEIKQTNPLTSLIGEITNYQDSVSDEIQVNGFKLQGLIIQGGCLKELRLELNEGGDYLPNGTILQWIQTNQPRKDKQ
ncbi:hypothetical protein MJO28_003103 [Puccinia striiformis f. sp. tritici]|uniref:Uncharacterized protein n=1 Tax=Puccinia striiformis f. sp. tritici TaxID=168172 RepID=A0ACC0ES80_9BASI|nr:hypothetical protein MJO28_003103 [Puccinia striiformis f. sp. tritici]